MTARTSLLALPSRRGDLVPAAGPSAPAAAAAPTTSGAWQPARTAGPFQRVVLTTALGSGAGVLLASALPSAPLATGAQLLVMVLGAATGLGAGRLLRSGWAVVVAPLAFGGAFTLWQVDASGTIGGPTWTIDAPAALPSGHGMVVFLVHLSILVGAAAAVSLLQPTRRAIVAAAALGCLFLGGLVGAMLWPASTPPVTDIDGLPVSDDAPALSPLSLPERRGVS